MNRIELDVLGPHWKEQIYGAHDKTYVDEAALVVKIDGKDIFSDELFLEKHDDGFFNRFEGAEPSSFLFNEYNDSKSGAYTVFNGEMLIGVCNDCRCEGCNDLLVNIESGEKTTSWEVFTKGNNDLKKRFIFDAKEYEFQITSLKQKYLSYSWEDDMHKIRRLCREYIRNFTTKNSNKLSAYILGCCDENHNDTDKLSDTIKISYTENYWVPIAEHGVFRPSKSWEIKWDGKTLESALTNLKEFAEKEFIRTDSPQADNTVSNLIYMDNTSNQLSVKTVKQVLVELYAESYKRRDAEILRGYVTETVRYIYPNNSELQMTQEEFLAYLQNKFERQKEDIPLSIEEISIMFDKTANEDYIWVDSGSRRHGAILIALNVTDNKISEIKSLPSGDYDLTRKRTVLEKKGVLLEELIRASHNHDEPH